MITVTQNDLRLFAEHTEKTRFTSSLSLYAAGLADQERCSVVIVTNDGVERERIDWEAMQDIARSLARIERRGQPQIRLKRAARR